MKTSKRKSATGSVLANLAGRSLLADAAYPPHSSSTKKENMMSNRTFRSLLPTPLLCLALALVLAPLSLPAATILPDFDSRAKGGSTTEVPTNGNEGDLGVGPVNGSSYFFRSYLTFDLSTAQAADTDVDDLTLTLYDLYSNENNEDSLEQNFTLFQVASDWHNEDPLPDGTDLATFTSTPGIGRATGDFTFSDTALTTAFNDTIAGSGTLYLGVCSPEGETAAEGTRSFRWFGSLEDSGAEPELTYTAIPEPASGALFVLVGGLLWFVRRRLRA